MTWRVEFRPEVEQDVVAAAAWYESRQANLGVAFTEEVIRAWDLLAANPLITSRRHPIKPIRWIYPDRFPYRIIYQIDEAAHSVLVIAVIHAARQDQHWQSRS